MQMYSITHDTATVRRVPEIRKILSGLDDPGPCPQCMRNARAPFGDLRVTVSTARGRFWPDAIGCGDYPCFVVSSRFVSATRQAGIRIEVGGRVTFVGADARGLSVRDAPPYGWLDGARLRAGSMRFEESGYVAVRFCSSCGSRSDDISATYARQHGATPLPTVIDYDAKSGIDLFTTDLAPTAFFCTDRVFECARIHRLTNLCFRRLEDGVNGEHVRY